jgi:hypothetical protein
MTWRDDWAALRSTLSERGKPKAKSQSCMPRLGIQNLPKTASRTSRKNSGRCVAEFAKCGRGKGIGVGFSPFDPNNILVQ